MVITLDPIVQMTLTLTPSVQGTLDMSTKIYVGSDHILKLTGVKDNANNYQNQGAADWKIEDVNGVVKGSGLLPYIAASNGNYQATISEVVTDTLVAGSTYYLTVTFASGEFNDERRLTLLALHRGTD